MRRNNSGVTQQFISKARGKSTIDDNFSGLQGMPWARLAMWFQLVVFCFAVPAIELAPERYSVMEDGKRLKLPYACSQPIDGADSGIDRLIVAIHGRGPNALDYVKNVLEAGREAPAQARRTLVIAPQFLEDGNHKKVNLDENDLYWTAGACFWGGLSSREKSPRISSFDIIDRMLTEIVRSGNFPRLKRIVIAGQSAGGQFVNRYAASSDFEDRIAAPANVTVRYVVCNPSTYVYFTGERVVFGTTTQFAVPDVESCSEYNEYGYGSEKLYDYQRKRGGELLREAYAKRNVIYLVGEKDNNRNDPSMSNSCRAKLQGRTRLERGQIYFNYLQHLFGPSIREYQGFIVVPDVGHSGRQTFKSKPGIAYLFDYPADPMENAGFREAIQKP